MIGCSARWLAVETARNVAAGWLDLEVDVDGVRWLRLGRRSLAAMRLLAEMNAEQRRAWADLHGAPATQYRRCDYPSLLADAAADHAAAAAAARNLTD